MQNVPLQQSELWEISQRLVAFNTVSALSNVEAVAYLANIFEDIGFTVKVLTESVQGVQKSTLLAWAGPAVPGGLILSGHTDIVPFEGQPGWTRDPLTLSIEGERLFGRGVSDMKVFLVQALLAAKKQPLHTLKRPLVYIYTCDEEVAGQGAGRIINVLPQLFADYPLPTVALIGEPTGFDIFPAHKGYAAFDLSVLGKGGHSSAPHKGVNAIEKMADVIALVKALNTELQERPSQENRQLFPDTPTSVLNCGIITGGLAPNMIAESCRLTVSIRVAPGDSVDELVVRLRERVEHEVVPAIRTIAPDGGVWIENVVTTPPLRSPTDNAFCELLCRVMERRADRGAPFATDGGQLQRLGIKSYICGPGLLEEAHQPNESMPVANFVIGVEKLERVIHHWCIAP